MVPWKKNFDILKKDVWVILHFRLFWELIKQLKSLTCFNLLLLLVEDWQLVAVVVLSLFLLLLIVIVL